MSSTNPLEIPHGTATQVNFNGWEYVREAPPDVVARVPPPASGRLVIALDPPALQGRASPEDETQEARRHEHLALLWKNGRGEDVLHDLDHSGCLLMGCQRDATWLPEGWDMDVFPTGWTLPHLEHWFTYALCIAGMEDRGDIPPGSEKSPSYAPTPRGLVTHAHLILRHLGLPGAPPEPRVAMDRQGCLAELRDLLAFFRRQLRPSDETTAPQPDRDRPAGATKPGGGTSGRIQGDAGGQAPPSAATLPEWVGEHFQRNQYKLLRLLWGRQEVPIADVYKALYGRESGREEALDKVKDRLNGKLAEIGQRYEVVTRRGEAYILRRVT
jgi:hypothetical protein